MNLGNNPNKYGCDYVVDHARGCVWALIWKCASRSLTAAIVRPAKLELALREDAISTGLPLVTFVRHPWERILSALATIGVGANATPLDHLKTWVVGVPRDELDPHLRPMHLFLDGFGVGFVGTLENFAADWARLGERYPLPAITHENRRAHPKWNEVAFPWDSLLPIYAADMALHRAAGKAIQGDPGMKLPAGGKL